VWDLVVVVVCSFGWLDSIVVSVGVGVYGGILDFMDDEFEMMFCINVDSSVWVVCVVVVEFCCCGEGGDVVVISLVVGLCGGGNEVVYVVMKFV